MISFKDVTFSYGEHEVLHHVSFTIPKGSYTCIVGHNGSGKSTIAKLMIGLYEWQNGEIIVDGKRLTIETVNTIRQLIGIVFQNPDNQFIGTTVEDDIAFTLENACVPQQEMQAIIESYAEKVGMKDYLKQSPEKLSGGQKQRVALAGVLAGNSKVIIFDESTSMLDPKGKQEILELIQALKKEKDLTIISITHDMEEVLLADNVIVLEQGTVVMQCHPLSLFENKQQLKTLNLKLPFVFEVVETAKSLGFNIQNHLTLESVVDDLCR